MPLKGGQLVSRAIKLKVHSTQKSFFSFGSVKFITHRRIAIVPTLPTPTPQEFLLQNFSCKIFVAKYVAHVLSHYNLVAHFETLKGRSESICMETKNLTFNVSLITNISLKITA